MSSTGARSCKPPHPIDENELPAPIDDEVAAQLVMVRRGPIGAWRWTITLAISQYRPGLSRTFQSEAARDPSGHRSHDARSSRSRNGTSRSRIIFDIRSSGSLNATRITPTSALAMSSLARIILMTCARQNVQCAGPRNEIDHRAALELGERSPCAAGLGQFGRWRGSAQPAGRGTVTSWCSHGMILNRSGPARERLNNTSGRLIIDRCTRGSYGPGGARQGVPCFQRRLRLF